MERGQLKVFFFTLFLFLLVLFKQKFYVVEFFIGVAIFFFLLVGSNFQLKTALQTDVTFVEV